MTQLPDWITVHRDLRTGQPVWLTEGVPNLRPRHAPAAEAYDVIVVGAGISGALTAYRLAREGASVLVIDRRPLLMGSTTASTAMIQFEIDTPLHKLARQIGTDRAVTAWKRSAKSVTQLAEIVEQENIQCGFARKLALYLAGDETGYRGLRKEVDLRVAHGLKSTFLPASQVKRRFGMDRTGGILSSFSASADPVQLTAGLLRRAQERYGAEIVERMEVTGFLSARDEVAVSLANGSVIKAQDVVFCTGYEFLDALSSRSHQIVSTWALCAETEDDLPGWLYDTIVWEASDPYLYFRTHTDGRIVVGGEDEPYDKAHRKPAVLKQKADLIRTAFTNLTGIALKPPAAVWAAAFGESATGLPFLGRVPGYRHVHALMGFGGNGITFSVIGSDIITASICGRTDPDADVFPFPDDIGEAGAEAA